MAQCPRCQTELHQDSGLVLCPNCGHPSLLDINGNIQDGNDGLVKKDSAEPTESEPQALDHSAATSEFAFFNNEAPHAVEAPQSDPFEHLAKSNESINLSEYANSEFSQGKNGAFVYNVSISDIDSKEIRDFLREAIEDKRFNWDAPKIISQITKGVLLLKNLSPVKASILISRIKRLPVKIRWEQYAITQADQESSTS